MRISDWSSDVCSSDLLTFGQDPQKQEMDMAGMSWEELIDQLRPLGEMMRNRIPEQLRNDPHVAQESVRLLLYGLARASSDALIGDRDHPIFVPELNIAQNIFQPNADTIYKTAMIAKSGSYRLRRDRGGRQSTEEHTSDLQSLMSTTY